MQKVYPSILNFLLGQDTGGYKAGIGRPTPQGIEGTLPVRQRRKNDHSG